MPPGGIAVETEEFEKDGVVYDKDGVRVTAFQVQLGEFVKPAYGCRIDYQGHAAVISGDTRFNENVINYAAGVDLLIHEVAVAKPALLEIPAFQRVMTHHTTAKETGTVFTRPPQARRLHSHIVRRATEPSRSRALPISWPKPARPMVLGEDLRIAARRRTTVIDSQGDQFFRKVQ